MLPVLGHWSSIETEYMKFLISLQNAPVQGFDAEVGGFLKKF